MGRFTATFGGVLALALLAGGLTEGTMALGGRGHLADDVMLRPATPKPTATATPTATPTPTPTPTATPAPTATPTPVPAGPKATTNSFVHMRTGASTSTPIIIDLNAGTVVELLPISNAQWQQVRVNGTVGYLFKLYLTY